MIVPTNIDIQESLKHCKAVRQPVTVTDSQWCYSSILVFAQSKSEIPSLNLCTGMNISQYLSLLSCKGRFIVIVHAL